MLIFDPLANVVCDAIIYGVYKRYLIKESNMFITSVLLNGIGFSIVVLL